MGWFDWCCCRRSERLQEDDEAQICVATTSQLNTDTSTVPESNEMGQTVSRIKKLFCPEKPAVLPVTVSDRNDIESATLPNSVQEPLLDRTWEPLASPRRPLIRGIGSLTPPDSPVLPPTKRLKDDVQYMDFPILKEEATVEYVNRNKLMVILKGLSGSGKSTVAKNLKKVYTDAVICSADHFFLVDGVYNFDPQKLKEAHASCQRRARQAGKRNCHVIVIDNTNIRHWEYQVYLQICKTYNYVPIVLEPQTPWRFDPHELAIRNKHEIEESFLAKKLKTYQHITPIYYAWFLNEMDSQSITRIARQWLERALLEVEDFHQELAQITELESLEDMLEYFTRDHDILHVTAKYTGRGKAYGAKDYINDPVVKGALGRCYPITVIGYVITPRTFGARIQLTEKELELWANDDYESPPDNFMFGGGFTNKNEANPPQESTQNEDPQDDNEDTLVALDLCQPRITITPQEQDDTKFCPTSGEGSRAHFTLGCAYGVKPVTTGFDLIDIVSCEQRLKDEQGEGYSNENENDMAMDVDSPTPERVATYNISGAVLKSYGEGRWVIYPDTKAAANSMFSAFY